MLAQATPERALHFRQRFDAIEGALHHLEILRYSRPRINRRLAYGFTGFFGLVLASAMGLEVARQRRDRHRLICLRNALGGLSEGRTNIRLDDPRRDTIGRIGNMIEETSRTLVRQRQRLEALANLESWQEAARRQAHELRTPLTAARLGLDRLLAAVATVPPDIPAVKGFADSAVEDLDRLASMISGFATFARLPKPTPQLVDLFTLVTEFADSFAGAWSNVFFEIEAAREAVAVRADRKMIRHVLANLCENSSQAAGDDSCTIRFSVTRSAHGELTLEIGDDGPGVADSVAGRLFEPYASTRESGDGLGLGLAIARKIMLDHGGDLELVSTSPAGTVLRLTFPAVGTEAA